MSSLKHDILVAGIAGGITLAACTALAGPALDIAGQAAEVAGAAPSSDTPTTVHGVDVVEVLILALAALGLGPVARILAMLKPVLAPVLKAILGRKADQPSPPSPPTPPPYA